MASKVSNPPDGFPRVTPYLLYEDLDAAVDWLLAAFGFEERIRMKGSDGRAVHAEVGLGDGVVMMGSPGPDYRNPKHLGGTTQLVNVYVDDVDAHCEKARAGGAVVLKEPEDQFYGDRTYRAEDPEGHHWSFSEHVRDVSPEDMHF
jgi:PhnB protein